ncbi:MAG: ATP-dependent DNA helicase RecG [Thermomicrobiales bacterium]|nr:ATP-dependent DNA helicase RecG [Thermomicrobiales bacterium]
MSPSHRQPSSRTGANAPAPGDPVERALEWLRREWRGGCAAGMAFSTARAQTTRLRSLAATHQAGAALDEVEARLDAYRRLDPAARRDELPQIANLLKALQPLLREIAPSLTDVGLLPEAIAPSRRRSQPAPALDPAPSPRAIRAARPEDPVTVLPRVGEAMARKLEKLGLRTVEDVLRFAPRYHIDYTRSLKVGEVLLHPVGAEVTLRGEIIDLQLVRGPGKPRVVAKLADETGWVRVVWFNQYLVNQLAVGDEIAVSGKLESTFGRLSFTGPEWEHLSGPRANNLSTGRLAPVYPATAGVQQKTLRALTRAALDMTHGSIREFLPDPIRAPADAPLPLLAQAYEMLHYPASEAEKELAERRLGFDELLLLQLGLVRRRQERQAQAGVALPADDTTLQAFRDALPFRLTGDQERSIAEVLTDMAAERPMARLLQGDVGSGKTAVAAAAMLVAHAAGFQSAMMAPTQILAEQHERNLHALYEALPGASQPRLALLTGNTRAAERKRTLAAVEAGEVDILIGTHALIEDRVQFARLALSVVDEQHRFGVRQRATLPDKATGRLPHQLAMTATPIPRTLNMVLNGDVDVSVIAERPPGRIPIETRRYVGREREAAYDLVREHVAAGRQAFVICPLVEASEQSEAKAAVDEAERLQTDVFPELRIAMLHGRMSGKEKDAVMSAFRDRQYDVLVSTSVIEVGIDIPNATVMLIEGADRFGLAQLHQFRGRVGRGGTRSWCLLLADEATPDGEERLQMMIETDDGFLLAQKDLELRGPGDFIGTRQSGLPEMSWIDGSFDTRLLDRARRIAEALLETDPELDAPDHRALAERLRQFWTRAAPDVPV